MLSNYLYIDADDTRINLTLKLVAAITNNKNNAIPSQDIDLFIITYINNGRSILLNNLDNPNYFIALFPTFFLFGTSGHLALNERSRKIKVSLNV